MGVIFQSGYSLPVGDMPLTHARIAHSGNWLAGGTVRADDGSNLLMETTDDLLLEDGVSFLLLEGQNATASGYVSLAPSNSLTYERWKPGALPATWEYDHGSAALCDYCCIGAHTMGTNGNTLQVQYWSGSAWVDLIPATVMTSDMAVMAIFGQQTRQRWRIVVSNGTAPEIGVIKFGRAMQMTRPIFGGHTPVDLGRQTQIRANYSETGEFLGRTRQRVQMASTFSWQHLDDAWIRSTFRPFQKAVEAEPFFIAWRPLAYSEVALCQTDEVPIPQNMGVRNLMNVQLTVRALAYD